MGWVEEREQDNLQDHLYTPKFLALRGSSLYKFNSPPVSKYCILVIIYKTTVYNNLKSVYSLDIILIILVL